MSANFLHFRNVLRENSAPQVDEKNNSSVQRGKRKRSQPPRKRRRTEEEKEREEEEQQVVTTSAESEEQGRSSCESARSVSSEDVSSEEQSSATDSEAEESRFLADGLEKYVQQERLGEGGFGSVYAGYCRDDLLPVAIKHIHIDDVPTVTVVVDGEEEEWPLEVALMAMAGEAGGASAALLDWYELQDELVIVMERPVPCMDLLKYLHSKGGYLEEEEAKVIMRQQVEGMIAIHSKGHLQRDIKPDNILVQTDPEGPCVRVLDYGCGCFLKEDPYSSYCGFGGTLDYTPPEWFLQGSIQAELSTVFQIRVVLYGMLAGIIDSL